MRLYTNLFSVFTFKKINSLPRKLGNTLDVLVLYRIIHLFFCLIKCFSNLCTSPPQMPIFGRKIFFEISNGHFLLTIWLKIQSYRNVYKYHNRPVFWSFTFIQKGPNLKKKHEFQKWTSQLDVLYQAIKNFSIAAT